MENLNITLLPLSINPAPKSGHTSPAHSPKNAITPLTMSKSAVGFSRIEEEPKETKYQISSELHKETAIHKVQKAKADSIFNKSPNDLLNYLVRKFNILLTGKGNESSQLRSQILEKEEKKHNANKRQDLIKKFGDEFISYESKLNALHEILTKKQSELQSQEVLLSKKPISEKTLETRTTLELSIKTLNIEKTDIENKIEQLKTDNKLICDAEIKFPPFKSKIVPTDTDLEQEKTSFKAESKVDGMHSKDAGHKIENTSIADDLEFWNEIGATKCIKSAKYFRVGEDYKKETGKNDPVCKLIEVDFVFLDDDDNIVAVGEAKDNIGEVSSAYNQTQQFIKTMHELSTEKVKQYIENSKLTNPIINAATKEKLFSKAQWDVIENYRKPKGKKGEVFLRHNIIKDAKTIFFTGGINCSYQTAVRKQVTYFFNREYSKLLLQSEGKGDAAELTTLAEKVHSSLENHPLMQPDPEESLKKFTYVLFT